MKQEDGIDNGYFKFVHNYKSRLIKNVTFKESKKLLRIAITNFGISDENIRFRLNNKGRFTISLIEQGRELNIKLVIGDDHDDI